MQWYTPDKTQALRPLLSQLFTSGAHSRGSKVTQHAPTDQRRKMTQGHNVFQAASLPCDLAHMTHGDSHVINRVNQIYQPGC